MFSFVLLKILVWGTSCSFMCLCSICEDRSLHRPFLTKVIITSLMLESMDISYPLHTPNPRTSSLFPRRLSAFLPTSCAAPSHSTLTPPPLQCNLLKLNLATLLFVYYILSLNNCINDQGFNYHVFRNGTYIYIFLRPL